MSAAGPRPLDGIRIIELGQLIAGPFAGTILGYFGADVIKVEPPTGDTIRGWRGIDDGTSLWWRSLSRNKRCVAIDLRSTRGQDIVRKLITDADVLIENFRPGVLERWNLAPAELEKDNPRLVVARVSGFGQTGPYSHRPGYANVCEAIGGLRHLTGHPGEVPVRPNLSLGDTLAGINAALGILLALYQRDGMNGSGMGQLIDVALFESVFGCLESIVPEFDRQGTVRGPSGTTITGVVPTGTYHTVDNHCVVLGANNDTVFARLCSAMEQKELAANPKFASNVARVQHQQELDELIASWAGRHTRSEILEALEVAGVPCGPIYSIDDMMADPHFRARGLFENVTVGGKPLKLGALGPRLSKTPGRTTSAGPDLGFHTHEVLSEVLGMDGHTINQLLSDGVVV